MTRRNDPPGTAVECRSCGALMVWTTTERGKGMPCDVEPADDGDFYLFRRDTHILALHRNSKHPSAQKARERDQRRHHSHFSTCPNAGEHRRSR